MASAGLPLSAPVERYAAMRAALDKVAFLRALPGAVVLIRLDERGGDDEPAPWAFRGSGLPFPIDVPASGEDVFLSMEETPSEPTQERPIGSSAPSDSDCDSDAGPRPRKAPPAPAGKTGAKSKGKGKGKRGQAPTPTEEASPFDRTATGPMFSLSLPAARGRATVHVVPHGTEAVIGRDKSCDVVVPERSISKKHARLLLEATRVAGARARGANKAQLRVVDLGSQNGVAINGRKLPTGGQDTMGSGDVLDLGDVSLLVLDAGEFWDGLPRLTDG
ncbi:MAG: FHA domain-containing protein [Deltaproteobacteria bacterium]|nr:FHA domain-containing protein [Deltaproteobacteria bacterium]